MIKYLKLYCMSLLSFSSHAMENEEIFDNYAQSNNRPRALQANPPLSAQPPTKKRRLNDEDDNDAALVNWLTEHQAKLGEFYEDGEFVPQDFTKAEMLYRQAAEGGHKGAQKRLNAIYNWELLPVELKLEILSYIDTTDILQNIALVNKECFTLSTDDSIWRPRFITDFQEEQPAAKTSWKETYKDKHDEEQRVIAIVTKAVDTSTLELQRQLYGHFRVICLSKKNISYIPNKAIALFNKHDVAQLWLSDNPLKSLPSSLTTIISLKELWLDKTKLTFLPDWLSKLPNLKDIDIAGTPIAPNSLIYSLKKAKIGTRYQLSLEQLAEIKDLATYHEISPCYEESNVGVRTDVRRLVKVK